MSLPFEFDYAKPDYCQIIEWRANNLNKLRSNPELHLPVLKAYYKEYPGQFITDWGWTFNPQAARDNTPSLVPFILFEKQDQWIAWAMENWKQGKHGITQKSRRMGVSWLAICFACTLCLFNEGVTVGFGSLKMDSVDKLGDPSSLLEKARIFLSKLPQEFLGNFDLNRNAPHMRIMFPDTNCVISGLSGNNIARGGNLSLLFLDESAHLENQEFIERATSFSTNCKIDISTPNGTNNSYYRRLKADNANVFTYLWRDYPGKDDIWYQEECKKIADPLIIAQELDLNYEASVDYIVIPNTWVQAAVDAHIKLNVKPTGSREASLDIADQGKDLNALACRQGIMLEHLESWSGKGSDIYESVERAVKQCLTLDYPILYYDGDGLGSGARGDARKINESLPESSKMRVFPFIGSSSVISPLSQMIHGRKNEDLFLNLKSQSWWSLRLRFLETYRAVVEGLPFDPEKIISISSSCNNYMKLLTELSQPTYRTNDNGKIIIEKMPDGARSPNLADAVMMLYAPHSRGWVSAKHN